MESWRKVWRVGFGPLLPLVGLAKLAEALRTDDKRLLQGATTSPPPLQSVQDWPVDAADAIGFCGWQDDGLGHTTVGDVEKFFAQHCHAADVALKEPAACRWFLNWYDDAPRDVMRRELLAEVEAEIATRGWRRSALLVRADVLEAEGQCAEAAAIRERLMTAATEAA